MRSKIFDGFAFAGAETQLAYTNALRHQVRGTVFLLNFFREQLPLIYGNILVMEDIAAVVKIVYLS